MRSATNHPKMDEFFARQGGLFTQSAPSAITIHSLRQHGISTAEKKHPKKINADAQHAAGCGRHVEFQPYQLDTHGRTTYELLRKGIDVEDENAIAALLRTDGGAHLTEAHFYLFRHRDESLQRNATIPRYEAAYWCKAHEHFIRVQKSHLKPAYANAGRKDATRWDDVDATDGTPYWVDRHAFRKQRQRESKQHYEQRKKRMRGGGGGGEK